MKRSGNLRRTPFPSGKKRKPRKAVSPASTEQREKVASEVRCRYCKIAGPALDPAHVIPRSMGGCDDADCVVGLCRYCHRRYDGQSLDALDLLPYLTREEQAHAVAHLGLMQALRRVTGERHIPESERGSAAA